MQRRGLMVGQVADNEGVVDKWATGLANGMVGIGELLAPNVQIWHSTDGEWLTQEVAQQRMMANAAAAPAPSSGFREVRGHATASGGVIQAVIDRNGGITHVVQVLTIEDGRIVALEEYLAPQE